MACPMNYVEPPDVPEGLTLREYRCLAQPLAPRRRRRLGLRRVVRVLRRRHHD